ncbi:MULTISPECIES: transglycosylase SLT domain-containing protein [Falsihalocynthiibacter]|uniref:transglycosylase SLT domain-containing protein n=1 Tax=Falsihalocynthiibacter TaxID=2854182 RepID=UPI003003756C
MVVFSKFAVAVVAVLAVSACGNGNNANADIDPSSDVVMRWDHRPESDIWTKATLKAISDNGSVLTELTPRDIEKWCPAYIENDQEQRALFWSGLASALAKHESTWNPKAVGGGGRWIGLVQIAPATARNYGCNATSVADLKVGKSNLSCAMKIWSTTVSRDGVVADNFRGVAADWGPFHNRKKREDMRAWTNAQSYCTT